MPAILNINTAGKPAMNVVPVGQTAKITNLNSATTPTLYVGDVNSATNTFALPSGATRLVPGPAYITTVSDVRLMVVEQDLPPDRNVNAETRFWVGGIQPIKAGSGVGANTVVTANTANVGPLFIPHRTVLSGLTYLIGTTGGTALAIAVLYDKFGAVQAYSLKTGTVVGTANTYQSLSFVTPYEVLAPGRYFGGVILNSGASATLQVQTSATGASGDTSVIGGTVASASDFTAAPVDITPPATVGPIPIFSTF